MLGSRRMLGLAVAKGSVTAVEVAGAEGGVHVRRAAEFVFPDGIGPKEADRLGKAFKDFLRKEGFSASRCVMGLDASRFVARETNLPPGSQDAVARILTLAVEREFASDRKDLVFDYAAGSGENDKPTALLVAAPRQHVDNLVATARAAGLTVTGLTSSTMTLADSANGLMLADRLVLHVFRGGVELAMRSPGGLILLWRLAVSAPPDAWGTAASDLWLNTLAHETRRAVYARLGDSAFEQIRELLVWDETGRNLDPWNTLGHRLGTSARLCTSEEARGPGQTDASANGSQYSAAAAMALAGLKRQPLPIDFLHSRLAPRREVTIGRKVGWGIGVAAAALLAVGLLVIDLVLAEHEVANLETWLVEKADTVAAAKDVVAKHTHAGGWHHRRPPVLDCLREVTLAFPAEGEIWSTSLRMDEQMRGTLAGKAGSETLVLGVLDRLKANARFTDVMPLYLREAGRGGREVAFALSFRFTE